MEVETFSRIDDKNVMTVHDVAQYLRLSRAKVYRWPRPEKYLLCGLVDPGASGKICSMTGFANL